MEKICDGDTASEGIGTGTVRFLFYDVEGGNINEFQNGEILVCDMTDIEVGRKIEVLEKKNKPPVVLQEYIKRCPSCEWSKTIYHELEPEIKLNIC